MKITHITGSVTQRGGGIPVALDALVREQLHVGLDVRVLGWDDGGDAVGKWPSGVLQSLPFEKRWGLPRGKGMDEALGESGAELVHLHGLWTGASLSVLKCGKPQIISPHGMLDAWALANSAWKKRIAGWWFENRNLRGAACLHALCESEAESMRTYGLGNPIAVIPNGVEIPEGETAEHRQKTTDPDKKRLLFLGRVHPKKGLANALRAWASQLKSNNQNPSFDEWQFVIAGWDQGGHEAELKKLATELGICWADVRDRRAEPAHFNFKLPEFELLFTGPAFGKEKDELLQQANAFILPSFSEGLPMSVLEAWSYRLPVLMTDHCNLPEGFDAGAAIRIGTDVESISEGMGLLFSLPTTENESSTTSLISLGSNGRALVERQFTWPKVAAQMKELYQWITGNGDRPDFVH
ncbi:MAG: glycosyltransferase [Verrucomicrobiae bacterium]|nr:glycosyltransferase [Verrucomicrobiae bacterium]NNJ44008.1 glycosyltransferase [Akkermansiaceae bacterium]